MIPPMPRAISLNTPIEDLHNFRIARLVDQLSHKLALALATHANKRSAAEVTVEDLLNYLPMRYEDRSHPAAISDLTDQMEASLELVVRRAHGYPIRKGYGRGRLFIFEVVAYDAGKTAREVIVWWFVSGRRAYEIVKYYTEKLAPETRFITFGRWEWNQAKSTYKLQLHRPADELEILPSLEQQQQSDTTEAGVDLEHSEENISDPSLAAIHVGRRVPVYRKLGPFNSKRVREIIHAVLTNLDPETVAETLPADLLQRTKLIDRTRALHEIHFPPAGASMEDYELARSAAHTRMIFEDFFWVTFALGLKRGRRVKEAKNATLRIGKAEYNKIASVLPFKLTDAQRRVTREIFADLKSGAPMNRLVQGDVGSGKTIIAVIAMIAAMENNLQTALMAPTEILAEQHARNIKRLLAKTPYRVELLTGSLRAAEKRRLRVALQAGEIQAVIGTHALVQEGVAFERLGLVVNDEQHRFGVMQQIGRAHV